MAKVAIEAKPTKLFRHYPFRRKSSENPYEALLRIDTKINSLLDDRQHWLPKVSEYALSVVSHLETEYRLLIVERQKCLEEINQRHSSLMKLKPNVVC